MTWRQNPQRVAWVVLTVSFLSCCLLTVAVPLGVRSFLLSATRPIQAFITATAGTVQLVLPGADEPTAVTFRRVIPERGRVVTDASAKSLLTVFANEPDGPILATIQLYQDSDLELSNARAPRFAWSFDPNRIALDLQKGRVSLSTQSTGGRPVQVQLHTPNADITLGSGTYDVAIEGETTQVRTRTGLAHVLAAGREVT